MEQAHKSLAKEIDDEAKEEARESQRLGTNIAAVIYDAEPDFKTLVRAGFGIIQSKVNWFQLEFLLIS